MASPPQQCVSTQNKPRECSSRLSAANICHAAASLPYCCLCCCIGANSTQQQDSNAGPNPPAQTHQHTSYVTSTASARCRPPGAGYNELRCVLLMAVNDPCVGGHTVRSPKASMCSTLLPICPRTALSMVPVPLLDSFAMLTRRKRSAQVAQSSQTPGFMARSSTASWPG
jgi:hypothetical protein